MKDIDYREAWTRLDRRLQNAQESKLKIRISPPSAIWAYFGMIMVAVEDELADEGSKKRSKPAVLIQVPNQTAVRSE